MHQRAVIRKLAASLAIMLVGATIALAVPFVAGYRHEARMSSRLPAEATAHLRLDTSRSLSRITKAPHTGLQSILAVPFATIVSFARRGPGYTIRLSVP